MRIVQFLPAGTSRDGVTAGAFLIEQMLLELGYESRIFCCLFSPEIETNVEHCINPAQIDDAADLILVHHSMGHDFGEFVTATSTPKVLIYHNITPPHFFPEDSVYAQYSVLGREQLAAWRDCFLAAVGDSEFNSNELVDLGYSNVVTIPVLVDSDRFSSVRSERPINAPVAPFFLSVGRIVENKQQHKMIEALSLLTGVLEDEQLPKLILSGGITCPDYDSKLRSLVSALKLDDHVCFLGKTSDQELLWLYKNALALWSISDHEGFCMPLVEANMLGLPVIAGYLESIESTLGIGGLLLRDRTSESLAAASLLLLNSATLASTLAEAGCKNSERFMREAVKVGLADFLTDTVISRVDL